MAGTDHLLEKSGNGSYVSIGDATGYAPRPGEVKNVHYIGPLVPTDWQHNDVWTDTSGAGSGTGV